jgi:hypothetical protein
MADKPFKTFRVGNVQAAVWKNDANNGGVNLSVTLQKSYKVLTGVHHVDSEGVSNKAHDRFSACVRIPTVKAFAGSNGERVIAAFTSGALGAELAATGFRGGSGPGWLLGLGIGRRGWGSSRTLKRRGMVVLPRPVLRGFHPSLKVFVNLGVVVAQLRFD